MFACDFRADTGNIVGAALLQVKTQVEKLSDVN